MAAWDELKECTKRRIREWLHQLLVDKRPKFLGRARHQRRPGWDAVGVTGTLR